MEKFNKEEAYFRAKHRTDQIRGFYTHCAIYLIVNGVITMIKVNRNLNNGETLNEAFFDLSTGMSWMVWGFGLCFHAFYVFGLPLLLGKNWEQEKLKKFMDEELGNTNKN